MLRFRVLLDDQCLSQSIIGELENHFKVEFQSVHFRGAVGSSYVYLSCLQSLRKLQELLIEIITEQNDLLSIEINMRVCMLSNLIEFNITEWRPKNGAREQNA